jgi:hypothetical protein
MKSLRLLDKALLVALAVSSTVVPRAPAADEPRRAGSDEITVDEPTARTLDGALRWLASKQSPAGYWADGNNHRAAITAYVTIAFLANGHLPNEGEHGRTVQRAVDFLLTCVRPDGYIAASTGDHNMYGHGIACIALGEVYGQTRDPTVRTKLERAIKLIIQTQNDKGGWRYQPRRADDDISVSVLQVVALRVAKNSGIEVPQETIDRAVKYVKSCNHVESGGFTYQPRGGSPGFARTAAAIYSLQVCGLYDDAMVARGSKFLFDRFGKDSEWFTYGNFYAAPAQYMIGGETWERWYRQIHTRLMKEVKREGELSYWRPIDGGRGVNEVFATAVYSTILAMPYSYLPLYQR